ncbi:MAG TPA: carbohydrate porin [Xanthobacteraceae bacterium]
MDSSDVDARWRSCLIATLGVALVLTAFPGATRAEDLHPASSDIWQRDRLTGDWGGGRTALSNRGIDISLNFIGETLGILSGGFRQGASFEHRFELSVDTDLDKLLGWKGATAHTTYYQIGHANGLPVLNYVGSIADPSFIEALPATRLFTAWFQQNFHDDKVSLRIGQIAADDEFLISTTAANLINSTFGYAALLAAGQLQGGPVYPLATPGIRLQLKPTDEITILSAVFSGAPAGADCVGLPQECNRYGTTFPLNGGALWMEELQYGINQAKDAKGMPGVYKLGGWYASTSFADLHFGLTPTGMPVSLASPASAFPLMHQGNWGIYGVADQMVWRAHKGPQSVNVFLRAGASPSDRDLVQAYLDGGVGVKAPLPSRPDDVLSFGFAYSQISADAAALDRDTQMLTGGFFPVRDKEILFELNYLLQVAPWWTFQADLQEIIHPGGNVPNPLNPAQAIPDAFIVGGRTTIKF